MTAVKKYIILLCFIMFCYSAKSQHKLISVNDSLKGKSYDYFLDKFENDIDIKNAQVYSAAFLSKAKAEKNWPQIFNAYKIILHQSEKQHRIFYADSMIIAAKHTGQNEIIGSAFLTKGVAYYDLKNYNNALDNYLIADSYIALGNDEYLEYKTKYCIALIKYYLGFYDEAVALFSECINHFKDHDDVPYLTSLHSLSMCYNRMQKFDLCSNTNKLGIQEAEKREYYEAIPRFVNTEGINQYFKKNYTISIGKLNETLPDLKKRKDIANETLTYFYLGKNYLALNQPEKAIPYLLKVDKAFTEQNYIHPDLRENYELLIDYYKDKRDLSNQLKYVNRLLLADKYMASNYKYLSSRIDKEYDTKKLTDAKNKIEKSLHRHQQLAVLFLVVILFLVVSLCFAIHKVNENKRKFKKLMERSNTAPKAIPEKKVIGEGSLDINPEVISSILKHLEKFEQKEKFLINDITLAKVAKMFDSNIVYVSKIIAYHKQKKFVDYINDLRIDYIIEKLKTNSKFRNYTTKALSEEAGFGNAQHFSRAFVKNTGITPNYFVKQINKKMESGEMP